MKVQDWMMSKTLSLDPIMQKGCWGQKRNNNRDTRKAPGNRSSPESVTETRVTPAGVDQTPPKLLCQYNWDDVPMPPPNMGKIFAHNQAALRIDASRKPRALSALNGKYIPTGRSIPSHLIFSFYQLLFKPIWLRITSLKWIPRVVVKLLSEWLTKGLPLSPLMCRISVARRAVR